MEYSPARYALLRDVANGRPDVACTDSTVFTDLLNNYLVDISGLRYVLTTEGAQHIRAWNIQERLASQPGLTVRRARRCWRCVCAERHTGYQIELRYPPEQCPPGFPDGRIVALGVDGPGSAHYARSVRERMERDNPGARVTITAIGNPDYRPSCRGDIAPGEFYAEHHGQAKPGQSGRRFCLGCAQLAFLERDVNR